MNSFTTSFKFGFVAIGLATLLSCNALFGQSLLGRGASADGASKIANTPPTTVSLITAAEYCLFLNARASADSHYLYNERMASDPSTACITREGQPENYYYRVVAGRENFPISYITDFDALCYCNWSQNSQPEKTNSLACNTINLTTDLARRLNLLSLGKSSDASNSRWTSWNSAEVVGAVAVAALGYKFFQNRNQPVFKTPLISADVPKEEFIVVEPNHENLQNAYLMNEERQTTYLQAKDQAESIELTQRKTEESIAPSIISYLTSFASWHVVKFGIVTAYPPAALVLHGTEVLPFIAPQISDSLLKLAASMAYNSCVDGAGRQILTVMTSPSSLIQTDSLLTEPHPIEFCFPKFLRYSIKWTRNRDVLATTSTQLKEKELEYQETMKNLDTAYADAVETMAHKRPWMTSNNNSFLPIFPEEALKKEPDIMTQAEDQFYYHFYTDQPIGVRLLTKEPTTLLWFKNELSAGNKIFINEVLVPKGTRYKKIFSEYPHSYDIEEIELRDLLPKENFRPGKEWISDEEILKFISLNEENELELLEDADELEIWAYIYSIEERNGLPLPPDEIDRHPNESPILPKDDKETDHNWIVI
ncbi:MAG: hypothetical protein ACH346_06645 [Chthoniobacterales bacterium]